MLVKDATFQRGVKDTADSISQEKPLAIGNKIWMHNPNRHKALSWFMKDGGSEPTDNHIFGHLEGVPNPNFVQYDGPNETSQLTTGLVFNANTNQRIGEASRVYFPKTNEIIRFEAEFANSTTSAAVSRNFGRGNASTSLLKKGDIGIILPPAWYQGFTMGKGISSQLTYKAFATSEVSYPVEVTTVENAERSRAGNPFLRSLGAAWDSATEQMEAELLFGGKKEDNSSYAHPLSVSEGLDNFITTNVYSATKISRMDFFDIVVEWQILAQTPGAILCSSQFKSMVTAWAMSKTQITIPVTGQVGEGKLGLSIDRVSWTVGTFDLIDVDLLSQHYDLLGKVFLVPSGHYKYRYLDYYENLDIAYRPVARDEVHVKGGEIYGVYGHEFAEEERFGKIEGIQF